MIIIQTKDKGYLSADVQQDLFETAHIKLDNGILVPKHRLGQSLTKLRLTHAGIYQ